MPSRLKLVSVVLFLALSLFLIAFGALYASVHDMLFFHAAAVPERARDDVRPLYFALMTLIGGASIGLGLMCAWAALVPLRRDVPLTATVIFLGVAVALVFAAITAEKLAAATGAPTSWHIMGALMAVNLAAWGADISSRVLHARHREEFAQLD